MAFSIPWYVWLGVLGGGYIAYINKWPPFTPDTIKWIQSLIPGNQNQTDNSADSTDPALPGYTQANNNDPLQKGPNPSAPISTDPRLLSPTIKPDPKIQQDFIREMYKQIYLPYDKYPYLYQNLQNGMNVPMPYNTNQDPGGYIYGFRPPIQGGDVPASQQNFDDYFNSVYDQYGIGPAPGGDATGYQQFANQQQPVVGGDNPFNPPVTVGGDAPISGPPLTVGPNYPSAGSQGFFARAESAIAHSYNVGSHGAYRFVLPSEIIRPEWMPHPNRDPQTVRRDVGHELPRTQSMRVSDIRRRNPILVAGGVSN